MLRENTDETFFNYKIRSSPPSRVVGVHRLGVRLTQRLDGISHSHQSVGTRSLRSPFRACRYRSTHLRAFLITGVIDFISDAHFRCYYLFFDTCELLMNAIDFSSLVPLFFAHSVHICMPARNSIVRLPFAVM